MSRDVIELDLRRLDRDLKDIEIRERSAFGDELHARLVEEHRRGCGEESRWGGGRRRSEEDRRGNADRRGEQNPRPQWVRCFVRAAAILVLLIAGTLSVPGARAAIATWMLPQSPSVEIPSTPSGPVWAGPRVEFEAPVQSPVAVDAPLPAAAVPPGAIELPTLSVLPPGTVPRLADRERAREVVAAEYPPLRQANGVGGRVKVLMWVRPDGWAESPHVEETSGAPELDLAAMRATRSLRFVPATRWGEPVGTWVSMSILFEPNAVRAEPESEAFHIPLVN